MTYLKPKISPVSALGKNRNVLFAANEKLVMLTREESTGENAGKAINS
jgi:hypothetical protein